MRKLMAMAAVLAAMPLGAAQAGPESRAAAEAAFLAALPPSGGAPAAVDADELGRLVALNNGHADALRSILEASLACDEKVKAAAIDHSMHAVAHSLSDEALASLTTFYTGPDYARFGTLSDKTDPSAAEKAEIEAMMARYRLGDFAAAMQKGLGEMWSDSAFVDGVTACATDRSAAFAAQKLEDE